MDSNYSWLAIRGAQSETIHQLLGLSPTGEFAAAPGEGLSGARLSNGSYLMFANRFDYADHTPLAELSAAGELITCCVNESMMYSSISGWRAGQRVWYFVHDGAIGIQHMHIEGAPPPEFHAIANRLSVVQAEGEGIAITLDHIVEVAPQVAYALTGFRHDEAPADEGTMRFERLAPGDRVTD